MKIYIKLSRFKNIICWNIIILKRENYLTTFKNIFKI